MNDMAPHNRGISLAESVEKMKEARVKLKEGSNQSHGPVMKKPAKGPSNPSPSLWAAWLPSVPRSHQKSRSKALDRES